MRFLRSMLIFGMFALPLCSSTMEYSLEIKPQGEGGIYEMNVNSVVTFQAQGLGKDAGTNQTISAGVNRAWWSFDKKVLVKISSDKNSITLKAIKAGTCKLSVNAMVNNHPFEKSITVLIK